MDGGWRFGGSEVELDETCGCNPGDRNCGGRRVRRVVILLAGPPEKFAPPREVTIEKGEPFRQIARALADAGVVRSELALRIYGQMSGTAREIKPGDYAFKGGERISDVMRHLVKGDFIVVTITIPEGLTVHEIAERVGRRDWSARKNSSRPHATAKWCERWG